jgi:hypothetical protein
LANTKAAFQSVYILNKGAIVSAEHNRRSPSYLEPNRNTMQKPIEGLPALALFTLFKGEGVAVLSTTEATTPKN